MKMKTEGKYLFAQKVKWKKIFQLIKLRQAQKGKGQLEIVLGGYLKFREEYDVERLALEAAPDR
jgi:hypothetical protein